MSVTPRWFHFALLSVIVILLLIEVRVYDGWNQCRNHRDQKSVSLKAGDEFNCKYREHCSKLEAATHSRKRTAVSGVELLRLFKGVRAFVMFIGHPRSVSSLTASLLDAHPEMMISHEFHVAGSWYDKQPATQTKNVTKYKLFYGIYSLSEEQALFTLRSPLRLHSYHVPGQWQGTYKNHIKVIGDKRAGGTSIIAPSKLLPFFKELEEVTEIPLRLIHLVRNPFDNIATMMLRELNQRDAVRNTSKKVNNSKILDYAISFYFQRSITNKYILEQRGDIVLTLRSYEIIQRPRETLQKLCNHLMVTCSQDYVEACKKILFKSPSVTRNSVVWTEGQKERVLTEMKKYPFLENFSFEDIS